MYNLLLDSLPLPPRIPLLNGPTILQRSRLAWGDDTLYWKRDDLTPLGLGGNKLRKLEFLMADALKERAGLIITCGAPQSNHVRLTAVVSAMFALSCSIVVPGEPPSQWNGNLLLDRLAGAEVIACGEETLEHAMKRVASEQKSQARNPYIIPLGGSNVLGSLGYFLAFFELLKQAEEQGWVPGTLVCSAGSAGTLAGLVAANALLPQPLCLVGVNVTQATDQLRFQGEKLASEVLHLLRVPRPLPSFTLSTDFAGPGYGLPSPASAEVIIECFRTDGILFDPVYTGKGVAAVKHLMRHKDPSRPLENIVFWHTGGGPAIFDPYYYTELLGHI